MFENVRNVQEMIMQMFTHAEQYDRHALRLGGKLYDRVVADVQAAGLADGARVLDVGTGPGRIPHALAAAEPQLIIDGVDLSPQMISYARERGAGPTFTVGDVADLPYPDASFDLIVSSLSQHHWSDVEGGIRDLRRVLRRGGMLWIYDLRWGVGRARRAAEREFEEVRRDRVGWVIGRLWAR